MTDRQWRQAWDLYQSASALPPRDRDSFIDSFTEDPEIRCEVRTMLTESADGSLPEVGKISQAIAAAAAGVVRLERSPGASPQVGASFGRYTILRAVGRGGMGEVYEASDSELDRTVALKFLPAGSLDQPHALARFIREARSLSALNHPNIVTVHEVIQKDGYVAIVMEMVEGQPLRYLCGPGPMPLAKLAHIGQQIARALEAAHAGGIIHGDIKPENVMVRPDGYAKVLDFGLAKRTGTAEGTQPAQSAPEARQGPLIGTFRYMAPEQLSNGIVAPASDVFSLGLVLYELAAGRHPFGTGSTFSALKGNAYRTPEPLRQKYPEIPATLDGMLLSMLHRDPAERLTAAEVVTHLEELARATDPRNVSARGMARRTMTASVCGAALVLGGALWFGIQSRGKSSAGPPVRTRPLTSQLGRETEPALSPAGDWIAYLWTNDANRNPGLYVQSLKSDVPKLVDTGSSQAIRAIAFSPDGDDIAFRTQDGIYRVAREGSANGPKKAASTTGACEGSGLDWSPDGKSMVLADCPQGSAIPAVVEVNLASGTSRRLTHPPAGTQGDFDPRYSPDGSRIAFRRATQPVVEDLYVLQLRSASAKPEPISRDARGLAGLAWMPDGKSLLVSSQRSSGIYGLWRFYLDKPFEPEAFTQAGQHAKTPVVARHGFKAAWINQVIDHNIWELPLHQDVSPGGSPKRLIASLQRDVDGHIGPDGRIAFRSDRSGVSEIWIAQPDGSNAVRVTSMNGPLTGTPRWSPDGRYLAFDSRPGSNPDIYLLRCDATGCQGPPRRLTDDASSDVMPSWSMDSKFLYFGSGRSGRREVWKLAVEGAAEAIQVTRNGGYLAMESSDGRWLYYSKIVEGHGLWRMPLHGSAAETEERVADLFDDFGAGSWLLAPGDREILFLGSGKDTGVRLWNILTRKMRLLHDDADHPIERGLSITADRKRLLFSKLDRSDSNIMIADGVR